MTHDVNGTPPDGEEELEPLPGGEDLAAYLEIEIDPDLTKTGEVGENAGKPIDFRFGEED